MTSPDRGAAQPGLGILAKLYRSLLVQSNVTLESLDAMITRWLDDPVNEVPKDAKTRSFRRGNLMKALSEDDMTFKTFMKGSIVLAPDEIEITVKYKYPNRVIEHTITVAVRDIDIPSLDYPDPNDDNI